MKNIVKHAYVLLLVSLVFLSCNKDNDDQIERIHRVNSAILDSMQRVYLWYEHLPDNVNPASYSDPADFIAALRYTQYDHWSTALTVNDFYAYFVAGRMIGHGFMVGLDENENFRIISLYRNTKAWRQGVKRGWIISKINGSVPTTANYTTLMGPQQAGLVNNFEFNDNGVIKNISLSKQVYQITPVIDFKIIDHNSKKIGYLVFQDFIDQANAELQDVFDSINSAGGVDEMVIDLRYNGGGSVEVAQNLAGWLLGKNYGNQPFIYMEYNDKLAAENDTMFKVPANANGLDLTRLFFIGTEYTASASELVVNSVNAFIPAILAGDTTNGKPVGMNGMIIDDYVVLPITFKYTNKNHVGDFYGGMVPQLPAMDDFSRDFGDPEEKSFKAILNYIDGELPVKSAKTGKKSQVLMTGRSTDQFIKTF